jgi:hypothetical protein
MQELVKHWLFDPVVGKFIAVFIALVVVYLLSRIAQRSINRFAIDASSRYRGRKFVAFRGSGAIAKPNSHGLGDFRTHKPAAL